MTEDISKLVFGGGGSKEFLEQRDPNAPRWTRQTFRIGIIGPSGSGKTTLVGHLIKNALNYSRIYVLSKTADPVYDWLKNELLAPVEQQLGAEIMHIYHSLDEFPALEELGDGPESATLVVIDDFVLESKDARIRELAIRGRHHGVALIILAQDLFRLDITVRAQLSHLAIFRLPAYRKAAQIWSEYAQDLDKKQFMRIYDQATARKQGGFLWISLNEPRLERKYLAQMKFPLIKQSAEK